MVAKQMLKISKFWIFSNFGIFQTVFWPCSRLYFGLKFFYNFLWPMYRVPQKNWVLWSVGLTSSLTSNAQIVCSLQYRPMGSKIFLFILHGSKKIVKNFQAKIQSGTWPKYSLKNTKIQKNPKFWEIALQGTIVIRKWLEFWLELLTIDYDLPVTQLFFAMKISKFWIFSNFSYFSKCILTMLQTVFLSENFLQFSLTHVG